MNPPMPSFINEFFFSAIVIGQVSYYYVSHTWDQTTKRMRSIINSELYWIKRFSNGK